MDYSIYFENTVNNLIDYLKSNNLQAMVLGISGGIDSTVCATICYEVSKRTGIPLIGRSLPTIHNKEGETTTADLVGNAFCTNYQQVNIEQTYKTLSNDLYGYECALDFDGPQPTALTNGNIQARLRMIYLYNLAGMYKGLVIDTDNLTEHYLGYWTLHGDVGDYKPIGNLWKTEVFKLAKWLIDHYKEPHVRGYNEQATAIIMSLNLKPTAGLGITNDDLEELGAESYEQVDSILQEIVAWKKFAQERGDYPTTIEEQKVTFLAEQQMLNIPIEIIVNVVNKHFNSEFKRK